MGRQARVRGSEPPAEADRAGSRNNEGFAEALMRQLADELEEDGRRVIGDSLAAVAQQYEDAAGFGTNALRARAEKFYNSGALAPRVAELSEYQEMSLRPAYFDQDLSKVVSTMLRDPPTKPKTISRALEG